ncbi:hypothetical protein N9414_20720 [Nodularia spumigena CCY9414]|nr:hypothetical protein N9414_20720 [Nodularia spumigena CCY9414]
MIIKLRHQETLSMGRGMATPQKAGRMPTPQYDKTRSYYFPFLRKYMMKFKCFRDTSKCK